MEQDTGAAMSLISQSTYDKLFSNVKLCPSDIMLNWISNLAQNPSFSGQGPCLLP